MIQEPFDILGYWEEDIFFLLQDKVISIKHKLPKEDLVLKLKVEPEDVKALRDEILWEASQKPLTYDQKENLLRGKYD